MPRSAFVRAFLGLWVLVLVYHVLTHGTLLSGHLVDPTTYSPIIHLSEQSAIESEVHSVIENSADWLVRLALGDSDGEGEDEGEEDEEDEDEASEEAREEGASDRAEEEEEEEGAEEQQPEEEDPKDTEDSWGDDGSPDEEDAPAGSSGAGAAAGEAGSETAEWRFGGGRAAGARGTPAVGGTGRKCGVVRGTAGEWDLTVHDAQEHQNARLKALMENAPQLMEGLCVGLIPEDPSWNAFAMTRADLAGADMGGIDPQDEAALEDAIMKKERRASSPLTCRGVLDREEAKSFSGLAELLPEEGKGGPPKKHDNCAVVGNSRGLLLQAYGAEIDSYDAVLRINQAPTAGFEASVGSNTTYRLINRKWADNYKLSTFLTLEPNVTLIASRLSVADYLAAARCIRMRRPDVHVMGLSQRTVERGGDLLRELKQRVEGLPSTRTGGKRIRYSGKASPSSGFLAVVVLLQLCSKVSVYGVGDGLKGAWHYFENRNFAMTSREFSATPHHSFDLEHDMLQVLQASGHIAHHSYFEDSEAELALQELDAEMSRGHWPLPLEMTAEVRLLEKLLAPPGKYHSSAMREMQKNTMVKKAVQLDDGQTLQAGAERVVRNGLVLYRSRDQILRSRRHARHNGHA